MALLARGRLGWRRDVPDGRDWTEDDLGLGTSDLPSEHTELRAFECPIFNQGNTNSCVAQSFAGVMANLEGRAGLPYVPVSRLAMYYDARRHRQPKGPLLDRGTYIRSMAKMVQRLGAPDEELWPFIGRFDLTLRVNRRPNFRARTRGFMRSGLEYYTIFSGGDDRITAIKSAIVSGYPVVFGVLVDGDFGKVSRHDPFVHWPGDTANFLGGHAMVIIGYIEHHLHGLVFLVRNSWGTNWGDEGYAWFTEEYIREARPGLVIIKGHRKVREALDAAA